MNHTYRLISVLLLFCLFLSLFCGCSNQNTDENILYIDISKAIDIPHTGKVIYTSEEPIQKLLPEENGTSLFVGYRKTLLGEDYQPTTWVSTGIHLTHAQYGRYSIENEILMMDGVELPFEIDFGDRLLGFWVVDQLPHLMVNHVIYDSVEIDVPVESKLMLYPLSERVGKGILVTGLESVPRYITTDGRMNYWCEGGGVWRTDGNLVEFLGDTSLSGVSQMRDFSLCPVEDGFLVASDQSLFYFTPGIGEETAKKPDAGYGNIILGTTTASPNLGDLAAKYNMTSKNKVEVKEYRDRAQLNLSILSGEVDMVGNYDAGLLINYAKRGVLEPLENVIGEVLSSGELEESILEACRFEGQIYMVPNTYTICGMLMPKAALEAAGGRFLSMTDLVETLDGLEVQNFYKGNNKEILLNQYLFHGLSAWVDDENNTCNFEDENFLTVLRLCNLSAADRAEAEANSVEGQKPLFQPYWEFTTLEDVTNLRLYYEIKGTEKPFTSYGTEGEMFPSPTNDNAGFTIDPDHVYGVLSQSEKKGSCADFLNWLLSEEIQQEVADIGYWGFPIRHPALVHKIETQSEERALEKIQIEEEINGTLDEASRTALFDQIYQDYYAGYAKILHIVKESDHFGGDFHRDIKDIIHEEADRYFSGDISLEQAAAYIQNRASIYLAEQG